LSYYLSSYQRVYLRKLYRIFINFLCNDSTYSWFGKPQHISSSG